MNRKRENCFSPWAGFSVIVVVCVLMAGAIFFEFNGTRRHGTAHPRVAPAKAAVQTMPAGPSRRGLAEAGRQAAFSNSPADVDTANSKLVF